MGFIRLDFLGRVLVRLGVALLVLILLLLAAGRLLAPRIDDYSEALTDALEQALGGPVQVARLAAEWHGWTPEFHLYQLRLERDGVLALQAEQLTLRPDLVASLWHRTPVLRRVQMQGAALDVTLPASLLVPTPTGGSATGISTDDMSDASGVAAADLFAQLLPLLQVRELRVRDSRLRVSSPAGQVLEASNLALGWRAGLGGQQLQLGFELQATDRAVPVDLRVVAKGTPAQPGYRGRFYLNLPVLEDRLLQPWLAGLAPDLGQLSAGGELWGQWRGESLSYLSGKLQVPRLRWPMSQGGLALDSAEVQLRLHREAATPHARWQLQLEELRGELDGQAYSWPRVLARWDSEVLDLSLEQIDLAGISRWSQEAPWLPSRVREELSTLQPEGHLRNVQLELPLAAPQDFHLQADLEAVGVAAWKGAPELRGVHGLLQLGLDGGRVDFSSLGFRMFFPRLYDQGWDYQQASGVVHWSRLDGETRVESELLDLHGDDLRAAGRFSLSIPQQPGSLPVLSLLIGMQETDSRYTAAYVPDQVVSADLKGWLSRAIRGGTLRQGLFVFHGPTGQLDGAPATTQMFFDVAGGRVDYHPDWPGVQEADVHTLVKGREALITVNRGRIYDTRLRQAQIRVPAEGSPRVLIGADLDGDARDLRRVLLESPLAQFTRDLADWQLTGPVRSSLDLQVPLSGADPRVRVAANLREGRFASDSLDLAFEALSGKITYTDRGGLQASALEGRLFGQPVRGSIQGRQDHRVHTRISLQGRVPMSEIRRRWELDILRHAVGETDYRAVLDLCNLRPGCSQLKVDSQLQGVALELPAPYGKHPDSALPLSLQLGLGGQEQRLTLNLDRQWSLALRLNGGQLQGGELNFGGQAAVEQRPGFRVNGRIPELDVEEWQRWWGQAPTLPPAQPGGQAGGQALPAIDPLLREVRVSVGELKFGEERWENLRIRFHKPKQAWVLALQGEPVSGYVQLPTRASQPWEAHFDYLRLGGDTVPEAPAVAKGPKPDPLQSIDPASLPAVVFSSQALSYQGEDYGHWQFRSAPLPAGVRLEQIRGKMRGLDVEGSLDWIRTNTGQRTHIRVEAKGADLGDVLVAWQGPRSVVSRRLEAGGELSWDASPLAFRRSSLNGEVGFRVEDGRFLETSAAGNTLRIFGLMNLNTIGRRLRLDFSDLLREGISFDRIKGRYLFNLGVGVSDGPLEISGPSANFELEGSLNLAEETLNQTLTLILPVSENLPIAAVLLGAPQVAGAVFLIEKLAGKRLARYSSARYSIYGSWSDPQVELMKAPPSSQPLDSQTGG